MLSHFACAIFSPLIILARESPAANALQANQWPNKTQKEKGVSKDTTGVTSQERR